MPLVCGDVGGEIERVVPHSPPDADRHDLTALGEVKKFACAQLQSDRCIAWLEQETGCGWRLLMVCGGLVRRGHDEHGYTWFIAQEIRAGSTGPRTWPDSGLYGLVRFPETELLKSFSQGAALRKVRRRCSKSLVRPAERYALTGGW